MRGTPINQQVNVLERSKERKWVKVSASKECHPNVKSMQIAIYDEEGLVACPTAGVRHSLDEVQRVLD